MRILFTTDHRDAASTLFNEPAMRQLGEIDGITFDSFNRRYSDYDVALFMGYDPQVAQARQANPNAKIGVIDARPRAIAETTGADFLVANGLEVSDWYADYCPHIFTYYICPQISPRTPAHGSKDSILVGYHGNKVHLQTMFPYVATALDALADDIPVELLAIYNVAKLGKLDDRQFRFKNVSVRDEQWAPDVYERELAKADIGIVPNLVPVTKQEVASRAIATPDRLYAEVETDILARYKPTSNAGRVLAFAQLGIPVVADMYPSALDFIRDGETGFVGKVQGGGTGRSRNWRTATN